MTWRCIAVKMEERSHEEAMSVDASDTYSKVLDLRTSLYSQSTAYVYSILETDDDNNSQLFSGVTDLSPDICQSEGDLEQSVSRLESQVSDLASSQKALSESIQALEDAIEEGK